MKIEITVKDPTSSINIEAGNVDEIMIDGEVVYKEETS